VTIVLKLLGGSLVALLVVTGVASATPRRGIEIVRESNPLSFCVELHGGAREFQVRLRNNLGVSTRVTVSAEGGPAPQFVLAANKRIRTVRGPWNGKHHPRGCRVTVAWNHSRLVKDLPLAQE
jgi:hypothetical protein